MRCSAGLDDGRQVGLCKPEEGDLVGEPASCRGVPITEEDHLLLVLRELLVPATSLPLDAVFTFSLDCDCEEEEDGVVLVSLSELLDWGASSKASCCCTHANSEA